MKSLERLRHEGLDRDIQVTDPNGRFYRDPVAFALHHFAFIQCYFCKFPYVLV